MRIILIGIAVAAALSLSACGKHSSSPAASGTSSEASSGNTAAVNVKKFCTDYPVASNDLAFGIGGPSADTHTMSDLRKAQAEAPPAVKNAMTKMLNAVVAANNARMRGAPPTSVNLTAESTQIRKWGISHCPNRQSWL